MVSHKRGVPFRVIKVKISSISCRFSNNKDDSVSICFDFSRFLKDLRVLRMTVLVSSNAYGERL